MTGTSAENEKKEPPVAEAEPVISFRSKFLFFMANITLEPLVFLNSVASAMQNIVLQKLMMHKSCLTYYENATLETCTNLTDPAIKNQLASYAVNFNLYRTSLELAPCILIALLIGSWSDRHGRKLLVIVPLCGDTISSGLNAIFAYFVYTNPYWLLLGSALQGITGGNLIFGVATHTYVIESSTEKTRTTRLAFIEMSMILGLPVGLTFGGIIYMYFGEFVLFLTSFILNMVGMMYALVRLSYMRDVVTLPENQTKDGSVDDVQIKDKEVTAPMSAFRDAFRLENITDLFRVFRRKREGRKQYYMFATIFGSVMLLFPKQGTQAMGFLFTQVKFNWTVEHYSFVISIFLALICVGTLVLVPFLSYVLKVSDSLLGCIASFLCVIGDLLYAFSVTPLMIYIAGSAYLLIGSTMVASRSLMSKCVDTNELGKLLSFLGCLHAISPIIAGFVYSQTFRATMIVFPGACYLISAILTLLPAIIFGWIYLDLKKQRKLLMMPPQDAKSTENIIDEQCTKI